METPVLLIAFNRPLIVQRVVDRVIQTGAEKVYVCIDGPRPGSESDRQSVAEVRAIVTSSPWPRPVRTRFREKNLGSRHGVADAINWFFSIESEGIILEDDCLPDLSFFEFSTTLLALYREDNRIGAICGTTHFPLDANALKSYRFTRYPHQWGWATWARAWRAYDSNLESWRNPSSRDLLRQVSGGSILFPLFWTRLLDNVASGKVQAWDYIWFYSFWRAGYLAVSPGVNLVENIGFGSSATHTKSLPFGKNFHPKAEPIKSPFRNPYVVAPDTRLEALTRWLVMGIAGKLVRSLLRLCFAIVMHFLPDCSRSILQTRDRPPSARKRWGFTKSD